MELDETIFDRNKTGTERVEVLHVISEVIFALTAKITYQTKLKMFLLTCYSRKQDLFLLSLYANLQLIITSWATYLGDSILDFNLMKNDLFIIGDTNIKFLIMVKTSWVNLKT